MGEESFIEIVTPIVSISMLKCFLVGYERYEIEFSVPVNRGARDGEFLLESGSFTGW